MQTMIETLKALWARIVEALRPIWRPGGGDNK